MRPISNTFSGHTRTQSLEGGLRLSGYSEDMTRLLREDRGLPGRCFRITAGAIDSAGSLRAQQIVALSTCDINGEP